jgi:hypothetical protein
MFEPTERNLIALFNLGRTEGGEVLRDILDSYIEGARFDLVYEVRADDFAKIAGAQAVAKLAQWFKWHLEAELDTLFTEYGIEKQEEDDNEE